MKRDGLEIGKKIGSLNTHALAPALCLRSITRPQKGEISECITVGTQGVVVASQRKLVFYIFIHDTIYMYTRGDKNMLSLLTSSGIYYVYSMLSVYVETMRKRILSRRE